MLLRISSLGWAWLAACLVAVTGASSTWAQSSAAPSDQLAFSAVETGMSTAAALDLIGRAPDHEVEVGAGCGVLHIMSWNDSPMRIISVGGAVSSVGESSDGTAAQRHSLHRPPQDAETDQITR